MSKQRRRKCKHCGQLFRPDPCNVRHQRYCSSAPCRRASKAASQRRWLDKPANRDYFRGPEQVERVRAWRAAHPQYWKKARDALHEHSLSQVIDLTKESTTLENAALQDLLNAQPCVLIGLIAHLTGAALQEDIALASRQFQHLAQDILRERTHRQRDVAPPPTPGA